MTIRLNTTALSYALRELLMQGDATTQEAICSALQAQGYGVNQSKVSRLLRKLGAVKSKNEQGQIVYRLPREPAPPTITSQLLDLVIGITANESLIIVTTSPGSAQLIARIVDYHKDKLNIAGTLAGDDTLFIAPKSVTTIDESVVAIRKLLLNADVNINDSTARV